MCWQANLTSQPTDEVRTSSKLRQASLLGSGLVGFRLFQDGIKLRSP